MLRSNDVLAYWFGTPQTTREYLEARSRLWFGGAAETDEYIRAHFTKDVEAASRGELAEWESEPGSCLALIVLLDQFSMNMERDSRRCYERSAQAVPIARRALERGFDQKVHFAERAFFYMPLEHSESLSDQKEAVDRFRRLVRDCPAELRETAESFLRYAVAHLEVIEKYGRFPGRNEVFGRESTAEEKKYLDEGGWF